MLMVNALWKRGVKVNGLQQLKVVTLGVNLKKVQGSKCDARTNRRITGYQRESSKLLFLPSHNQSHMTFQTSTPLAPTLGAKPGNLDVIRRTDLHRREHLCRDFDSVTERAG